MGRIIAVNMAHMKRRAARNKRDSVFEEIERTNKGTELHYLPCSKSAKVIISAKSGCLFQRGRFIEGALNELWLSF